MHIRLISVSRTKSGPYKQLLDEYVKRLNPYAKVEVIEVKMTSFTNESDRERVRKEEEERIQGVIPDGYRLLVLDEHTKSVDSPTFSRQVSKWNDDGGKLAIVIGGPLGLSDAFKSSATDKLSLSPMTFPHELAKVVFLEQLFRAFTIIKNKPYHY